MGVLYHLRYPLLALDLLRRFAVGRLMVFQTMIRGGGETFTPQPDYAFADESPFEERAFPKAYFIEHRYAGDPTNWWIPNAACAEAMLRSAGFNVIARPDREVFLCEPSGPAPSLPERFEEESHDA